MLVQELGGSVRLIRQQDHAHAAGALAHSWRPRRGPDATGPRPSGGEPRLPYRVVWTTGVHDAAWTDLDRRPILDPDTGRPFDFHRLPLERKLGPYADGVERISDLDAYAGYQVSRHYASFLEAGEDGDGAAVDRFLRAEDRRRERLRRELPARLRRDELLDRELAYLKLFDTLSLYVCLAGPGPDPATRPPWLVPDDRVETPAGVEVELRWRSDGVLALDPCPLSSPVELRVPCRELPARHGSQARLEESWEAAEPRHLEVRVEAGSQGNRLA